MVKKAEKLENITLSVFGTLLALLVSLLPLANAVYVMQGKREFLAWHKSVLAAFSSAHHGWVFAILCGSVVLSASTIGCWLSIRRSNPVYLLGLGPAVSEVIGVACSGIGAQPVLDLRVFAMYVGYGAVAGVVLVLLSSGFTLKNEQTNSQKELLRGSARG